AAHLMAQPDMMLITADLSDALGDSGTIAYVQIRRSSRVWTVENWLMSCRVLGRTVEERLFDYICERAREAGVATISALYKPSTKNAPFAGFYSRCGFVEAETGPDGEKRYTTGMDETSADRPRFVQLVEPQAVAAD